MPSPLHLPTRALQVAAELEQALNAPGEDLAPAALAIARVEYPSLDAAPYLDLLERMGEDASARIGRPAAGNFEETVRAFNEFFYDELGFAGNRERYDDPRNSFLNEVLTRRTGIPISLAVVYLEVSRRAGLRIAGVNFPGHFLLRGALPDRGAAPARGRAEVVIVDPFHSGALLSENDCRELLRQHVGDAAAFDRTLLEPATRAEIVIRMLVNLKRLYVRMRSFPQARFISDLLLAVDPSAIVELRDRGLLAYHLQDFAGALRDLEAYLRLLPRQRPASDEPDVSSDHDTSAEGSSEETSEHEQIWEHVKTLRKRVAGFN
ncbi:MAG TPA: transglutaminase-like domain-containing protein [Vicinamibacterales bacterium]|nr:transglutaminase-like domain-containing protein [Vicinamibacterales bacterium]